MDFLALDNELTSTLLRYGIAVIVLFWAIFCRLIAGVIKNERLVKYANRLFWLFIAFMIARTCAAFLDGWIGFKKVAWFSSFVGYSFHLYVLHLIIAAYRKLRREYVDAHRTDAEKMNAEVIDKDDVNRLFDELFDALNIQKRRTDRVKQNLERLKYIL